ncbi:MAG: SRPBCC family protein [Chloroflexota bacterium]
MTSQPIPTSIDLPEKKRRNGRFWRILLIFAGVWAAVTAVYLLFLWPWMKNWGAADAEIKAALPGDDMVAQANIRSTKGVTIQASPAEIYPWLLQLGVDRGGMYSYDWLENLFGLNVHTTDRIVPEYQNVQIGDFWRFTPKDYVLNPGPGLYVKQLIENEAVLLCFGMEGKAEDPCIDTWQLVLVPQTDGSTRLLLRSNMAMKPELPIKLSYFAQFLMERKMLLTLRERAEQTVQTN